MSQFKLYRFELSGHSHRAELFLSLLGLDVKLINVDLANGEHKQPAFLQKNIFGEVPVLEDGDIIIADSNAILVYLAQKYDPARSWLPLDAANAAEVQRFLSISAGPLAYGPATARVINIFGDGQINQQLIGNSYALLAILEQHLKNRQWLVNEHPTIADIANYTYIAHAPEGHLSLEEFPTLRNWLQRIESLPGFIPMKTTDITIKI